MKQYYATYDKFFKAICVLATDTGDIQRRLLHAWRESLWMVPPELLPGSLGEDFRWVIRQLNQYCEEWPGQLYDLRKKEEADPSFKKTHAREYPDPVELTLRKTTRKRASEIAKRVFFIYDPLRSMLKD